MLTTHHESRITLGSDKLSVDGGEVACSHCAMDLAGTSGVMIHSARNLTPFDLLAGDRADLDWLSFPARKVGRKALDEIGRIGFGTAKKRRGQHAGRTG